MVIIGPRSEAELRELLRNCYAFERKLGEIAKQTENRKNQVYIIECSNWYKEFADMLFLALASHGFAINSLNNMLKTNELFWIESEDLQRPVSDYDTLKAIFLGHKNAISHLRTVISQNQLSSEVELVLNKGVIGISDLVKRGQP